MSEASDPPALSSAFSASPPPSRSIAARLTLAVGTVGLAVFLVVGSLLQWALRHELERMRERDLDGKADVVAHFLDEVEAGDDLVELRHHLDDVLIGDGQLRIWLIADTGAVIYGGKSRPVTQPVAPPITRPATPANDSARLIIWREDGVALTGRTFRVNARGPVPAAQVLIGVDTRGDDQLLSAYLVALVLVCTLGVVSIGALGAWVARRELRPVRDLSREAAALSPRALSLRLSAQGVSAELHDLVDSFNRALDRVQAAYEHLEAFSADVAHELRTPLTAMISATEVELARERTVTELRDTLAGNLESLHQLAAMVNDMLFLARADRGGSAQTLEPTDLRELCAQVVEYFDAVLDERNLRAEIVGEARAPANAALVRRALANLLSNACRYTPPGQTIWIELHTLSHDAPSAGAAPLDLVSLTVRNPGADIDPGVLPHLFERFFRADASRQGSAEHHGLGLAIVRAVASMHGGEAFAHSGGGITEVGFSLRIKQHAVVRADVRDSVESGHSTTP